MDQTNQQPRGNFIAFINRDKKVGDKRPAFDGRIAIPGTEDERRHVLWAHEYINPKTGEALVMFNGEAGNVATSASALDQISSLAAQAGDSPEAVVGNLNLAAGQIVMFPNGFKDEAPEKDRPDYWGAYNPGNGEQIVRISAWAKKDRSGYAMLTGATSYPIPGKSEAQMQDAQTDLGQLVEQGVVSKGMPKKAAGRSGR
ncbi:MAG: hypothetical protein ABL893_05370 [Hyphomicrobium sp.]|nr:hypothetical protein [Hyphomicrobium sp.]